MLRVCLLLEWSKAETAVMKLLCLAQEGDVVRPQRERIECMCAVNDDTPGAEEYAGLWVQCNECLAWLHGHCVGITRAPNGEPTYSCHPVPTVIC